MRKSKKLQWIRDCWDYHSQSVSELDVAVDWGAWETEQQRCWCCGHESRLQKCHIIPKSLGGCLNPANIVPLCAQCHDESPDVADQGEMFRWIASQQNPVSGLGLGRYWHLHGLIASFERQLSKSVDWPIMYRCIAEAYEQSSCHCSQSNAGPKFKKSTREWIVQTAFNLYSTKVS